MSTYPIADSEVSAPSRAVPVLSCPIADLEDPSAWRTDLLAALDELAERPRGPKTLTVWAREGAGRDGMNRPAHLLYLYVVTPRGGAGVAGTLRDALSRRWQDLCRVEGTYAFVGGERPICGVENGRVVIHG